MYTKVTNPYYYEEEIAKLRHTFKDLWDIGITDEVKKKIPDEIVIKIANMIAKSNISGISKFLYQNIELYIVSDKQKIFILTRDDALKYFGEEFFLEIEREIEYEKD